MKISNLEIVKDNSLIRLSVLIESKKMRKEELWFSVPEKYGGCLCGNRMDAFLVGMLFPAMQYGEDIHLAGCVSEKLLFNVNHDVIPLLMAFSSSCKPIKVTADETSAERFNCSGVGTGFSGGVDSFSTLYDRFVCETSQSYKINRLVFLNVGSHGTGDGDLAFARQKFQSRYDYLKQFTDEQGLDFIPLDSNLHAFHPWGHLKTVTLTSVAGVLVLQNYFKKYYVSSVGYSYAQQIDMWSEFKEKSVSSFCDPIILPLLSTESLEFMLDGMSHSRVDKTLRIMDYGPVYQYLNVCVSPESGDWENCSVCHKCCRTLMTINSVGRLADFKNVFDVERYLKCAEKQYAVQQMIESSRDPFAKDNILLAKKCCRRLPHCLFLYEAVRYGYGKGVDVMRKIAGRILKVFLIPKGFLRLRKAGTRFQVFLGRLKGNECRESKCNK